MARLCTSVLALSLAATASFADEAVFATPQGALDAFIAGLQAQDRPALLQVFGEGAQELLLSGDPAEDAANRLAMLALYAEGYRFVPDGEGVTIALGADGWPFPIPLARGDDGWRFDLVAGEAEITARHIGLNELDTIALMDAYVDVQAAYRLFDHDGDGVMEFAQSIISSADRPDGLFHADGSGPVGEHLARAALFGWSDGETDHAPEPHGGYLFRLLTGQSDAAPGGAMSYLAGGNMVGGHALLAVPAAYGESGVHSFMVAENGRILEADLGEDSLGIAAGMELYAPDTRWTPVD